MKKIVEQFVKYPFYASLIVVFLLVIIAWAVFMYFRQLQTGLGVTGLNRTISWGFYIINFVHNYLPNKNFNGICNRFAQSLSE